MNCTCPVCGQTAIYSERYDGKWHRCMAGCAAHTRFIVVRDGVGVLEEDVAAAWKGDAFHGRALRGALALGAVPLVAVPLVGPGHGMGWFALLILAGVGAIVATAATHSAFTYTPPRPPGL